MSEDDLPRLVSRIFRLATAIVIASLVISTAAVISIAAGLVYLFFQ